MPDALSVTPLPALQPAALFKAWEQQQKTALETSGAEFSAAAADFTAVCNSTAVVDAIYAPKKKGSPSPASSSPSLTSSSSLSPAEETLRQFNVSATLLAAPVAHWRGAVWDHRPALDAAAQAGLTASADALVIEHLSGKKEPAVTPTPELQNFRRVGQSGGCFVDLTRGLFWRVWKDPSAARRYCNIFRRLETAIVEQRVHGVVVPVTTVIASFGSLVTATTIPPALPGAVVTTSFLQSRPSAGLIADALHRVRMALRVPPKVDMEARVTIDGRLCLTDVAQFIPEQLVKPPKALIRFELHQLHFEGNNTEATVNESVELAIAAFTAETHARVKAMNAAAASPTGASPASAGGTFASPLDVMLSIVTDGVLSKVLHTRGLPVRTAPHLYKKLTEYIEETHGNRAANEPLTTQTPLSKDQHIIARKAIMLELLLRSARALYRFDVATLETKTKKGEPAWRIAALHRIARCLSPATAKADRDVFWDGALLPMMSEKFGITFDPHSARQAEFEEHVLALLSFRLGIDIEGTPVRSQTSAAPATSTGVLSRKSSSASPPPPASASSAALTIAKASKAAAVVVGSSRIMQPDLMRAFADPRSTGELRAQVLAVVQRAEKMCGTAKTGPTRKKLLCHYGFMSSCLSWHKRCEYVFQTLVAFPTEDKASKAALVALVSEYTLAAVPASDDLVMQQKARDAVATAVIKGVGAMVAVTPLRVIIPMCISTKCRRFLAKANVAAPNRHHRPHRTSKAPPPVRDLGGVYDALFVQGQLLSFAMALLVPVEAHPATSSNPASPVVGLSGAFPSSAGIQGQGSLTGSRRNSGNALQTQPSGAGGLKAAPSVTVMSAPATQAAAKMLSSALMIAAAAMVIVNPHQALQPIAPSTQLVKDANGAVSIKKPQISPNGAVDTVRSARLAVSGLRGLLHAGIFFDASDVLKATRHFDKNLDYGTLGVYLTAMFAAPTGARAVDTSKHADVAAVAKLPFDYIGDESKLPRPQIPADALSHPVFSDPVSVAKATTLLHLFTATTVEQIAKTALPDFAAERALPIALASLEIQRHHRGSLKSIGVTSALGHAVSLFLSTINETEVSQAATGPTFKSKIQVPGDGANDATPGVDAFRKRYEVPSKKFAPSSAADLRSAVALFQATAPTLHSSVFPQTAVSAAADAAQDEGDDDPVILLASLTNDATALSSEEQRQLSALSSESSKGESKEFLAACRGVIEVLMHKGQWYLAELLMDRFIRPQPMDAQRKSGDVSFASVNSAVDDSDALELRFVEAHTAARVIRKVFFGGVRLQNLLYYDLRPFWRTDRKATLWKTGLTHFERCRRLTKVMLPMVEEHETIMRKAAEKLEFDEWAELMSALQEGIDAINLKEHQLKDANARAAVELDEDSARKVISDGETAMWESMMLPMMEEREAIARKRLERSEAQMWDELMEDHIESANQILKTEGGNKMAALELDEAEKRRAITTDENERWGDAMRPMIEDAEAIMRRENTTTEIDQWSTIAFPEIEEREMILRKAMEGKEATLWDEMMAEHHRTADAIIAKEKQRADQNAVAAQEIDEDDARNSLRAEADALWEDMILPMMDERESITRTEEFNAELHSWNDIITQHRAAATAILEKEASDATAAFEVNEKTARGEIIAAEFNEAWPEIFLPASEAHEAITRSSLVADERSLWSALMKQHEDEARTITEKEDASAAAALLLDESEARKRIMDGEIAEFYPTLLSAVDDHASITTQHHINDECTARAAIGPVMTEEREAIARSEMTSLESTSWDEMLREHVKAVRNLSDKETAMATAAISDDEEKIRREIQRSEEHAMTDVLLAVTEDREVVLRKALRDTEIDARRALVKSFMSDVEALRAKELSDAAAGVSVDLDRSRQKIVEAEQVAWDELMRLHHSVLAGLKKKQDLAALVEKARLKELAMVQLKESRTGSQELSRIIAEEAERVADDYPNAIVTSPFDVNASAQARWATATRRRALGITGATDTTIGAEGAGAGLEVEATPPRAKSTERRLLASNSAGHSPTAKFAPPDDQNITVFAAVSDAERSFATSLQSDAVALVQEFVLAAGSAEIDPVFKTVEGEFGGTNIYEDGRTLTIDGKAVLIHVWTSPRDAVGFHEDQRRAMQARTRHLVSASIAVPVTALVVHEGRLVTVAWLPPLVSSDSAKVYKNTVLSNALEMLRAEHPRAPTSDTANDQNESDASIEDLDESGHAVTPKKKTPDSKKKDDDDEALPVHLGKDGRLYMIGGLQSFYADEITEEERRRTTSVNHNPNGRGGSPSSSSSHRSSPRDRSTTPRANAPQSDPHERHLLSMTSAESSHTVAVLDRHLIPSDARGNVGGEPGVLRLPIDRTEAVYATVEEHPAVEATISNVITVAEGWRWANRTQQRPQTPSSSKDHTPRSHDDSQRNAGSGTTAVAAEKEATLCDKVAAAVRLVSVALSGATYGVPDDQGGRASPKPIDGTSPGKRKSKKEIDDARSNFEATFRAVSEALDKSTPSGRAGLLLLTAAVPAPMSTTFAASLLSRVPAPVVAATAGQPLDGPASSLFQSHAWMAAASAICGSADVESPMPKNSLTALVSALNRGMASLLAPQVQWKRSSFTTDDAAAWRRCTMHVAAAVEPLGIGEGRRAGEAVNLAQYVAGVVPLRDYDPHWRRDFVTAYAETFTSISGPQDKFHISYLRGDPQITHRSFTAFTRETLSLIERDGGRACDLTLSQAVQVCCGLLTAELPRWERFSRFDRERREEALEALRRVAYGQFTIKSPWQLVAVSALMRESMTCGGLVISREVLRLMRGFVRTTFPEALPEEEVEATKSIVGGVVIALKYAQRWRYNARRNASRSDEERRAIREEDERESRLIETLRRMGVENPVWAAAEMARERKLAEDSLRGVADSFAEENARRKAEAEAAKKAAEDAAAAENISIRREDFDLDDTAASPLRSISVQTINFDDAGVQTDKEENDEDGAFTGPRNMSVQTEAFDDTFEPEVEDPEGNPREKSVQTDDGNNDRSHLTETDIGPNDKSVQTLGGSDDDSEHEVHSEADEETGNNKSVQTLGGDDDLDVLSPPRQTVSFVGVEEDDEDDAAAGARNMCVQTDGDDTANQLSINLGPRNMSSQTLDDEDVSAIDEQSPSKSIHVQTVDLDGGVNPDGSRNMCSQTVEDGENDADDDGSRRGIFVQTIEEGEVPDGSRGVMVQTVDPDQNPDGSRNIQVQTIDFEAEAERCQVERERSEATEVGERLELRRQYTLQFSFLESEFESGLADLRNDAALKAEQEAEEARILAEIKAAEEQEKRAFEEAERRAAEETVKIETARLETALLEAARQKAEERAREESERLDRARLEAAEMEAQRIAAEEASREELERTIAETSARIELDRLEAAHVSEVRRRTVMFQQTLSDVNDDEEVARLKITTAAAARMAMLKSSAELQVEEHTVRLDIERHVWRQAAALKAREQDEQESVRFLEEEAARAEAERQAEVERIVARIDIALREVAILEVDARSAIVDRSDSEFASICELARDNEDVIDREMARRAAVLEAKKEAERIALAQAARVARTRIMGREEEALVEIERHANREAARIAAELRAIEETRRLEAVRVEAERKAAEVAARIEAARMEALRLEAQRKAAEALSRLETERRVAEEEVHAEAARLDAARREVVRAEAERKAADETERLREVQREIDRLETERQRAEADARFEADRLAAGRAADAERRAAEAARMKAATEEGRRLKIEREAAEEATRVEHHRRLQRRVEEDAIKAQQAFMPLEQNARLAVECDEAEALTRVLTLNSASEHCARKAQDAREAREEAVRVEAARFAAIEQARLDEERKVAEAAAAERRAKAALVEEEADLKAALQRLTKKKSPDDETDVVDAPKKAEEEETSTKPRWDKWWAREMQTQTDTPTQSARGAVVPGPDATASPPRPRVRPVSHSVPTRDSGNATQHVVDNANTMGHPQHDVGVATAQCNAEEVTGAVLVEYSSDEDFEDDTKEDAAQAPVAPSTQAPPSEDSSLAAEKERLARILGRLNEKAAAAAKTPAPAPTPSVTIPVSKPQTDLGREQVKESVSEESAASRPSAIINVDHEEAQLEAQLRRLSGTSPKKTVTKVHGSTVDVNDADVQALTGFLAAMGVLPDPGTSSRARPRSNANTSAGGSDTLFLPLKDEVRLAAVLRGGGFVGIAPVFVRRAAEGSRLPSSSLRLSYDEERHLRAILGQHGLVDLTAPSGILRAKIVGDEKPDRDQTVDDFVSSSSKPRRRSSAAAAAADFTTPEEWSGIVDYLGASPSTAADRAKRDTTDVDASLNDTAVSTSSRFASRLRRATLDATPEGASVEPPTAVMVEDAKAKKFAEADAELDIAEDLSSADESLSEPPREHHASPAVFTSSHARGSALTTSQSAQPPRAMATGGTEPSKPTPSPVVAASRPTSATVAGLPPRPTSATSVAAGMPPRPVSAKRQQQISLASPSDSQVSLPIATRPTSATNDAAAPSESSASNVATRPTSASILGLPRPASATSLMTAAKQGTGTSPHGSPNLPSPVGPQGITVARAALPVRPMSAGGATKPIGSGKTSSPTLPTPTALPSASAPAPSPLGGSVYQRPLSASASTLGQHGSATAPQQGAFTVAVSRPRRPVSAGPSSVGRLSASTSPVPEGDDGKRSTGIGPYCARPFAAVRGGELTQSLAASRVELRWQSGLLDRTREESTSGEHVREV